MTTEFEEALVRALPDLAAVSRAQLARFLDLLALRNAALNLTAARTVPDLVEHVRDSLRLLPYVCEPLVDVGSGGGFPALPLAIVSGCRFALIESVAKKARFLAEAVDKLGLPGAVVVERAEDAARRADLRARFRSATARAVGTVPTVLELTVPFLQIGGRALLQRGRFDALERRATADAALVLGAELVDEIPESGDARVDCPSDGERTEEGKRLLVVRKIRPTEQRFPRRAGIPTKRPLCREAT